MEENRVCCILVEKQHVKKFKCQIERADIANKIYRITKWRDELIAIPIHTNFTPEIMTGEQEERDTIIQTLHLPRELHDIFLVGYIKETSLSKQKFSTPFQQLTKFIKYYLNSLTLDAAQKSSLLIELPTKWEIHNDLILFPSASFNSDFWKRQSKEFWSEIAQIFFANRIGLISNITDNDFRTPQVELLLGLDGWVTHVDNGITYIYDVTKNMFCKGNITEKLRISEFDCKDEIVVDMFAGIGYFTLPYLVKAHAKKVIACEWNPDAVIALTKNLRINNVLDRCEVRPGDNREVAPTDVADRVNLGLIPTSQMSWKTACDALKQDRGGWLHIHENVESVRQEKNNESSSQNTNSFIVDSTDENNTIEECTCACSDVCLVTRTYRGRLVDIQRKYWCDFSTNLLHSIVTMLKGKWNVNLQNIEYVKSYAPHVDHLVFDVECRPDRTG